MPAWRRHLRVYLRLVVVQLRTSMEYRADFWISVAGSVLQQTVGIVFLIAFFAHVPALGGWTAWNVVLLYGLATLSLGLGQVFCNGVWRLRVDVNSGDFDRVLVRPVPTALAQLSTASAVHGFGNAGLGVLLVVTGLVRSDVRWHWWTPPFLLLAAISGLVITAAINTLTNLPVFWEPASDSSFPTMVSRLRDFAQFPLSIYPVALQAVVVVLPYAFISYFPALLLLERGGSLRWLGLATPLVAMATAWMAALVWSRALDKYQGAGH